MMSIETTTPEMAVAFVTAADVRRTATGPLAEFLAGRLAVTRALRTLTEAVRPHVRCATDGSPTARFGDTWVELSTSHLDGHTAAVATMAGCKVGIDLVRADAVMPPERRDFLSACEQCESRMCNTAVLWAIRSAAWKAATATRDEPISDLRLEFGEKGRVAAVHVDGETRRAGSMIVAPWLEYRAAVVWVDNSARPEAE